MKTQVMHSVKKQIFLISGRFMCFIMVIASVFYFGQSFSSDSPSVLIHEKNVIAKPHEIQYNASVKNNNGSEVTVITGEEHIYIAEGVSYYGLDEKSVNKITKRRASSPQPEKTIAKKEPVRKKTITHKPFLRTQSITSLPARDTQHYISLSGQGVGVAPGSSAHHFIVYQHNGYIAQGKPDHYTIQNYHYLFSAYSKTNRNGGGIRPPPFPG